MKLTRLFEEFFHSEKSAGIILIICTAVSLVWANLDTTGTYVAMWKFDVMGHDLTHWINDGLMAVFFLMIGLELEREIYIGELASLKNAMLPVVAAVGGMMVPAALHFVFNNTSPTQAGAGIPMATDIAFALTVLSLLGRRVPIALKVFLTALAVIDDLGAILVIAIFYTGTIAWMNLAIALGIFLVLLILNRLRIHNLIPYMAGGVIMWYFMLHSGIHATIAGVLLAFAIPFGNGNERSTSYVLQKFLHSPVAFFVLPLFALSNTAIRIPNDWVNGLVQLNSVGIFLGLFIGKPLGISAFSYLSVKFRLTRLPSDLSWPSIIATGFLGGIGFTMSIFITMLAFSDSMLIDNSKIAIILTSLIAGVVGFVLLKFVLPKQQG